MRRIILNNYKTNSQSFSPGDNLLIEIPETITSSFYPSISSEIDYINNIESLSIKAVITITDSKNNFIEERIYFSLTNDNTPITTISNLNTYINTKNASNNSFISVKVSIPKSTGYSNTLGSNNTFVGDGSGFNNTEGSMNTFIGMQTGYKNKTGERNIYIGNNSGYFNNDGDDNVFLGTNSGYYNKVNNNIFVGTNTGYNNYYGENNIFLGKNSGTNNLSSSNNIFLGESSGKYTGNIWNQESNSNIFLGSGAGYSNTLGNTNICIGKNAGYWLNESNNKVIIETPKKTNINTNNVTNYANRLYFTINSMFEYQQNDYIKIINIFIR